MITKNKAAEIIALFGLQPHPEGGFFVETFRSATQLALPDGRIRAATTAIYFLLTPGTFSALHRVASDEIWHFCDGTPLRLTTITGGGVMQTVTLGRDLSAGQMPQHVVPAGFWQGACPMDAGEAGYTLVGCTVSPGFDFVDFEMPTRTMLLGLFPQHATVIRELTRPDGNKG